MTLEEMHSLRNNSTLKQKVVSGLIVIAQQISVEDVATPGHSVRLAWARDCIKNPGSQLDMFLSLVLAINIGATNTNAILAANDAAIIVNLNSTVNFIAGYEPVV